MSASINPPKKASRAKRRTFDCSIRNVERALRGREIRAASEEDAKRLYLAAVIKALTSDAVEAVEVEVV